MKKRLLALLMALVLLAGPGGGHPGRAEEGTVDAVQTETAVLAQTPAPETEAPVTEAPVTVTPVPESEAPVTEAPVTETPAPEMPANEGSLVETPASWDDGTGMEDMPMVGEDGTGMEDMPMVGDDGTGIEDMPLVGDDGIGMEDMPMVGDDGIGMEDMPMIGVDDPWAEGPTPAPVAHIESVRDLRAETTVGEGAVRLNWLPGAEPYREYYGGAIIYAESVTYHVFRATEEQGDYEHIGSTGEVHFTDANVSFGRRYYYMVCTEVRIENLFYFDDPVKGTDTVSALPLDRVGTVQMTKGIPVDTNATRLFWQAVPDVTGYQLFRSGSPDSGYAWVKNTTGTDVSNYSLTGGQTYYYKVRAYRDLEADGGTVRTYGDFSRPVAVHVLGQTVVKAIHCYGTNSAFLSWEKVPGATAYQLFRKEEGVGEYVWIKNCTTNQVVNYALKPGVTYWFVVRAIYDHPDGRSYGAFSTGAHVTMPVIPKISGSIVTAGGRTTARLTWDRMYNVTGYQVYVSYSVPDEYKWLANATGTTYNTWPLTPGRKVYYKVRAYIELPNGERAYSAFSSPFVGTP